MAQEADESIQKENARRCEEIQSIRDTNEKEIQNLKESMAEIRHCLQSRINSLEEENRQLTTVCETKDDRISKLESGLDTCKSTLESAKSETARLLVALTGAEGERSNLEQKLKQSHSFSSRLEISNEKYEEKLTSAQREMQEGDRIASLKSFYLALPWQSVSCCVQSPLE